MGARCEVTGHGSAAAVAATTKGGSGESSIAGARREQRRRAKLVGVSVSRESYLGLASRRAGRFLTIITMIMIIMIMITVIMMRDCDPRVDCDLHLTVKMPYLRPWLPW
jgi:hypothetical protein